MACGLIQALPSGKHTITVATTEATPYSDGGLFCGKMYVVVCRTPDEHLEYHNWTTLAILVASLLLVSGDALVPSSDAPCY